MNDTTQDTKRKERFEWLRWIIVTLLIPFIGVVWNEVQNLELVRQRELERMRADSELVIKLLPALTAEPDSPSRGIALAVLNDLALHGAMGQGIVAAVGIAVQQSDERLRAGTATATERDALTQIAIAQDDLSRDAEPAAATPPDVAPEATNAVAPGSAGEPNVATLARSSYSVATPRVYPQIYAEKDRTAAERLREWVSSSKNWLAPRVENVIQTAAKRRSKLPIGTANARVVFFNDEDASRAQVVADWLQADGWSNATARRSKLKASPGQIVVWYPQPRDTLTRAD